MLCLGCDTSLTLTRYDAAEVKMKLPHTGKKRKAVEKEIDMSDLLVLGDAERKVEEDGQPSKRDPVPSQAPPAQNPETPSESFVKVGMVHGDMLVLSGSDYRVSTLDGLF